MKDLTIEDQIARMSKSDLSLCGIAWINEGRDIVLSLLLPPLDRKVRLVCRWASDLKVLLDFPVDAGSYPLSWDAELSRQENGCWNIMFDFASKGSISLTCTELLLEEPFLDEE